MSIQISFRVPKNQRKQIGKIYYDAFKDKISLIFSNRQKAEILIFQSINNQRIFVAYKDGIAVGFAGLQYHGKKFIKPTLKQIARIYGLETIKILIFFIRSIFNKPDPDQIYLEILAVSKDHRGNGIGIKLLKKLIEHAKTKKIPIIKLEVVENNPKAKKLYQKIGFKEIKDYNIPYPFSSLMGFKTITEMHYNTGPIDQN